MRTIVVTLALALLVPLVTLAAAPRVAVVYSSWPDGKNSFIDEYDATLAGLGWEFEKFENVDIAALVDRLDEFDFVIAASVGNYENPQDMTPYRDQWLAFLEGGGCLLISDASYNTALDQWVNTFGDDFHLTWATCATHREKTPQSAAIRTAGHPLLSVPNDLPPLLRMRPNIWAHIDSWPESWQSLVTCMDDKSLLVVRPTGKGLLVASSYYAFRGETGKKIAGAMLENIWFYVSQSSVGAQITNLHYGPSRPGPGVATVGLRNTTDHAVTVNAHMETTPAEGETAAGDVVSATLEPDSDKTLQVPFTLNARGVSTARLLFTDQAGATIADWPTQLTVPPAVTAHLKRAHLYPTVAAPGAVGGPADGQTPPLEVSLRLVPNADDAAGELRAAYLIDDALVRETTAQPETDLMAKMPSADLADGEHTLTVQLKAANRVAGEAALPFFKHPAPRFGVREDGVFLLDGEPFFPFGFYHVSQSFDIAHRAKMARDIAAAGFNCAHTRIMTLDGYQDFLDECAELGVYIVTEFTAPMYETVERYRDHPAVMAWNPGDEPAARGVSAETIFERHDRFKQLDPNHLTYTVICRPGEYRNYARGTDILAPDPYPIPNARMTMVYDLLKSARIEALKYDTTLIGVLQCFGGYGGWKRAPNARELRGMTYLGLLAGVKGIIYYTYGDGGWVVTDNPEQWEASKALVPEIKRLAPAVMDGALTVLSEGDDRIWAGYWDYEGSKYVVLVSDNEEPKAFAVPVAGATAKGLFRELPDVKLADGQLSGTIPAMETIVIQVD